MYGYKSTDWNTVNSTYTIVYTTTTGEVIYKTCVAPSEPPELEAGDTTALDEFLGGFGNAKE